MHIERSFAHIVDAGGMRRTTLRGWENLNKRFKLAAAIYNLSQLMRQLIGFGTPKQLMAALARGGRSLFSIWTRFYVALLAMIDAITDLAIGIRERSALFFRPPKKSMPLKLHILQQAASYQRGHPYD
jgi:hypothetical protein